MEAAQPLVWNARKPRSRRACGLMLLLVASLAGTAPPGARAQQAQAPIPREFQDTSHTVRVLSDSHEKVQDTYRLTGHVEVTYREMKVTADEATFDDSSGEVVARGHVTFTDPEARLEANDAHYNVESGTGWFLNAHGYVHARVRPRSGVLTTQNPFYLQAEKVERVDEEVYTLERGRITTCECEKKGWSVATREARVKVGDKVVRDRKSTRLNSSHLVISYAVFCLKKKKKR